MTDLTISEECFRIGVALIAEQPIGATPETLAGPLRHFLRLHAISGVAATAIAAGRLELPERVARRVRQDWEAAKTWSALVDGECARIGQHLLVGGPEHGLFAPIVLKGASVSSRYRDPSIRTYADIDLLVPPEEIPRWANLFVRQGYRAPFPEVKATQRRYQEAVVLSRPLASASFSVDLHACLFIEHRARDFTYSKLVGRCQTSPFHGLLRPDVPLQILVLALHLAHHAKDVYRLIWLRDFLELDTGNAMREARSLAAQHSLSWAIDLALSTVQRAIGEARWGATMPALPPAGLAHVHQQGRTHYLRHLAIAKELGAIAGARYFASRVTPRRFLDHTGRFDWRAALLEPKRDTPAS